MVIVEPFNRARDLAVRLLRRRVRVTVVGRAATDRGARYGKQLASHLGRQADSEWREDSATGTVTFDPSSRLLLSVTPDALHLTLTCPLARTDELKDVVSRHLRRFGEREGVGVVWRDDETAERPAAS